MVKVIYHGHSCFSLSDSTYELLIDPFITNNPVCKIKAESLNPHYIMVTHGHGDHLGDAIAIALRTKALIIAPYELALYCESKGAQVHGMHIGGAFKFPFGRVKLTPAWHGSAVTDHGKLIYTGCPCGFLVELEGKLLYHAGDTGLFQDMKLWGEMYELDCALIPIGDNYVMGPEDALRAALMLQAKITVPMHYNTFPLIRQDGPAFVKKLQSVNLRGQALEPEDFLEF